eukprot:56624-Prymnesium_polylepis.1
MKGHFYKCAPCGTSPRGHMRTARLGEAEVAHDGVASHVDEDVLRLQVAVDDVPALQVLDRRDDARRVESREVVAQLAARSQRTSTSSIQILFGGELSDGHTWGSAQPRA